MLVKAGSADRARIAQSLGYRVWGNGYGHPFESEEFLGCKLGTISRISTAAGGRSAGRPGEQGLWGSGGTVLVDLAGLLAGRDKSESDGCAAAGHSVMDIRIIVLVNS